jgi:hypothetical protein
VSERDLERVRRSRRVSQRCVSHAEASVRRDEQGVGGGGEGEGR